MQFVGTSPDTRRLIERVFSSEHWIAVQGLLAEKCATNLPLLGDAPHEIIERIQFAVIKLCNGKFEELERHIAIANIDWRDTLVAAGFGHSIQAHRHWFDERMGA